MSSVTESKWSITSTKKLRLLALSLFLSPQEIWFLRREIIVNRIIILPSSD
jgi:hypothetical protein